MKENISSKGLKKLFSFTFNYINFGRFDAASVLHHANYYHLLEELRERYLISKSMSYKKLMDSGYHLPLVTSQQYFLKPIHYNQVVIGNLYTYEMKNSSICIFHELCDESNDILHITITKHVLVSGVAPHFKVCKLTDELRELF